ncbi:hypothetical protein EDD99_0087 [Streptomyces sp. 846.5]|nr:hypothetical protein [Streptomyces sp. 846.5]TDU01717.1 hypothetical protein EDD99_0087 [Streptomyces sp. 846.5]
MPKIPSTDELSAPSAMSRRGLIKHATIAGAATVAAGLALNTGLSGTVAAAAPKGGHAPQVDAPAHAGEPFMVRVVDARTGELDIFHGHRHHRVRDQKLVNELLRAAR